jgi:hypothetical protein
MRRLASAAFQGAYSFRRAARILISLEKIVCIYHGFILEFKYTFISFTNLLFALSRFGFHPTFMLHPNAFFQIHHDSLVLPNCF